MITGIVFAFACQPKNQPMKRNLANLSIKALEEMYLRETQVLKIRLLKGAFLKDITKQRNKTIELALAIHHKQFGVITNDKNISVEEF